MSLPVTIDAADILHDQDTHHQVVFVTSISTSIRPLTEDDWTAWWRLRLLALASHPDAFAQDVDDALAEGEHAARHRFVSDRIHGNNRVFGAFTDTGDLVGIAGISGSQHRKLRHRMEIGGVYVVPATRGNGIGEQLIAACIEHARATEGVLQVHIGVASHNDAAIRLYERCGFTRYGREPRLLLLPDGMAVDEDLMVVLLDS